MDVFPLTAASLLTPFPVCLQRLYRDFRETYVLKLATHFSIGLLDGNPAA